MEVVHDKHFTFHVWQFIDAFPQQTLHFCAFACFARRFGLLVYREHAGITKLVGNFIQILIRHRTAITPALAVYHPIDGRISCDCCHPWPEALRRIKLCDGADYAHIYVLGGIIRVICVLNEAPDRAPYVLFVCCKQRAKSLFVSMIARGRYKRCFFCVAKRETPFISVLFFSCYILSIDFHLPCL